MSTRCFLGEWMKANKITAGELAARLGCKPGAVHRWRRYPHLKPQEMEIISAALGIQVSELYRDPRR
jgi:hypothetical protein